MFCSVGVRLIECLTLDCRRQAAILDVFWRALRTELHRCHLEEAALTADVLTD
jgi:hypothetical protein